jgi:serine/threonine-protein kinase
VEDERMREGRRLAGRYRLGPPLARGALCSVYRGEDETLARRVAIKAVAPAHVATYRAALAATPALAHPATVIVYDTVAEDGWLYLVQELVAGRALAGVLHAGLPAERAIAVGAQLAHLLAYAHQRDFIHGDVTPAAVLIERNGTVRLNNFGLPPDAIQFAHYAEVEAAMAAYLGADAPRSPLADGSFPASAVPTATSAAADVRAVGLLLWQALAPVGPTGERTGFRPDVPPELRGLVVRLLLPGHPDALTNAEDLAAALDSLAEELAALRIGEQQPTPSLVRAAREQAARAADAAPWSREDTFIGDASPWSTSASPGNSATTIPGMYNRAAFEAAGAYPPSGPPRPRTTRPLGTTPSAPLPRATSVPLPGLPPGPARGVPSGPLHPAPSPAPPSHPARLSAGPSIGMQTGRLSTPIAWSDDPEARRAVDEWMASARSPGTGTGALGGWLLRLSGGQRFRVLPVVVVGIALFALCFVLGYLVPLVIAPR